MKFKQALVIGRGIAGLVAARVLSDHFESVVVLDRDSLHEFQGPRPGASQGAHLHVLLERGQEILQELFPEMENIFQEEQCPIIDWSLDTFWETHSGVFPRYVCETETRTFSRPFLEAKIYSLVASRSNVSFQQGLFEDLLSEKADLIVAAGGQYFPLQRLLPSLDIDSETETLPIQITYRSVVFRSESLRLKDFKQYYYQFSLPEDKLGAVISPIEGGRHCIATLIQYGPVLPGKIDFAGYLNLAAQVPGGKFYQIIEHAEPLTQVSVFHKPTMYCRHLHKVAGFPENIFAMGDVFCSLNPVFGQGMTVALEQALLLQKQLAKNALSAKAFHRESYNMIRLPFLLSKMGSSVKKDFAKRYLQNYLRRCQVSSKLHQKFLRVLHLKASYGSLLDPLALIRTFIPGDSHD